MLSQRCLDFPSQIISDVINPQNAEDEPICHGHRIISAPAEVLFIIRAFRIKAFALLSSPPAFNSAPFIRLLRVYRAHLPRPGALHYTPLETALLSVILIQPVVFIEGEVLERWR